jgi:hypothetical protein
VLPTAELDAGKGADAVTDQVDEQCRAATNQQLSHPRSQAAAAVEDTDHRPTANEARLAKTIAVISADQPDENMYGGTTTTSPPRTHRDWTRRPRRAEFVGIKPGLFARYRVERRLAVFHDGRATLSASSASSPLAR